MDAGGGALGSVTCAQGQHLNVPYTDGSAVTCRCEDAWEEPQRARRSHREQLRQELRLDAAPQRSTAPPWRRWPRRCSRGTRRP